MRGAGLASRLRAQPSVTLAPQSSSGQAHAGSPPHYVVVEVAVQLLEGRVEVGGQPDQEQVHVERLRGGRPRPRRLSAVWYRPGAVRPLFRPGRSRAASMLGSGGGRRGRPAGLAQKVVDVPVVGVNPPVRVVGLGVNLATRGHDGLDLRPDQLEAGQQVGGGPVRRPRR